MGVDCSCLRSEEPQGGNNLKEMDMSRNKIPYTKQEAGVDVQPTTDTGLIQINFDAKLETNNDSAIHSAARGYIARKEIQKERESMKEVQDLKVTLGELKKEKSSKNKEPELVVEKQSKKETKKPKSPEPELVKRATRESYPNPEELYEQLNASMSQLQASSVDALEKELGPFDISKPLKDGVAVEKKPAFKLDNGTIYEGEWNANNQKHGRGVEINDDGSKYIGYFSSNKKEGKGRLIHVNYDLYQGEFKNDRANGHGIYVHEDGAKYEGEFKNDEQHGHGREEYPDGSVYEGDYRNGMKEGKGHFKWADGSQYEGDFKANNIEGTGTYVWADNKTYTGEWKNGKMHGMGDFKWADGREYSGQYKKDLKHGHGRFVWPDGRVYDGEWKEGKQHGIGLYTFYSKKLKEHRTRRGEWRDGNKVRWVNEDGGNESD